MVNENGFREDLYFRLSVININLPALHQRPEDIPLLVDSFLALMAERRPDLPTRRLTADALDVLMTYPWPGNVRELKNVIERASSLASGSTIERHDLHLSNSLTSQPSALAARASAASISSDDPNKTILTAELDVPYKDGKQALIDQFEVDYLTKLIGDFKGNISQASKHAGLTRYHLREMLKKHNLK